MPEQENNKKVPEVEFTFRGEEKTEEERKRKIEELIKKEMKYLLQWEYQFQMIRKQNEKFKRQ